MHAGVARGSSASGVLERGKARVVCRPQVDAILRLRHIDGLLPLATGLVQGVEQIVTPACRVESLCVFELAQLYRHHRSAYIRLGYRSVGRDVL